MPARSVSELLPRPFSELTVADVQSIVDVVGEERESLFFERKQQVTPASLAKSCSAFANTYGGLLLVGIGDDNDELVGVEAIAEPQVWVKDVLRGRLLPLPPFRARSLPLDDDRALLLVLVEESSSTPHLITRHGAIYVRNPGSSDPVPIEDQRRLLELAARGERARDQAGKRAVEALTKHHFTETVRPEILTLAPTGTGSTFRTQLFGPDADLQPLRRALGDHDDKPRDARQSFWTQYSARVERYVQPDFYPAFPDWLEGVEVWWDGVVAVLNGKITEPERGDSIMFEQLRAQIAHYLVVALDVLLELGAHGDAALGFTLPAGRTLLWPAGRVEELAADVIVVRWTSLELDEEQREAVVKRMIAEVSRALGIGPGGAAV